MHLHSQKIGRGVVVAAHSHREGRSPPGRWSWKVKDRNNQILDDIIFSLSLSPRIVAYIEKIDSPEERRGGATQRSLNPGKERRASKRREAASASHVDQARSSVSGAVLLRKPRPLQRKNPGQGLEGGIHTGAGPGGPRSVTEGTSNSDPNKFKDFCICGYFNSTHFNYTQ